MDGTIGQPWDEAVIRLPDAGCQLSAKAADRADRNSSNLSDRDGSSNSKLHPTLLKRDLAVGLKPPGDVCCVHVGAFAGVAA